MSNDNGYEKDWDDDEVPTRDEFCPCCGREYDEVDYEYQICHYCKFNNHEPEEVQPE
jgi:hypothetical protein